MILWTEYYCPDCDRRFSSSGDRLVSRCPRCHMAMFRRREAQAELRRTWQSFLLCVALALLAAALIALGRKGV